MLEEVAGVHPVYQDRAQYPLARFAGEWPEPPADALLVLLVHSDCEGEIKREHCAPLADRLEALLPAINAYLARDTEGTYLRGRAEEFIVGLRRAESEGVAVEFR